MQQARRPRGAPARGRDRDTCLPSGRPVSRYPMRRTPDRTHGAQPGARRGPGDVARLDVTTTLLLGSRVDALVHHTSEAALLAVGAPPHGLAERLWTGSTVTGTASRVRCPLVVVPPEPPDGGWARIVVGLKSTRHAEHLLGAAFAVAQQHQSDLVVVHAWRMLSWYDDAIAARRHHTRARHRDGPDPRGQHHRPPAWPTRTCGCRWTSCTGRRRSPSSTGRPRPTCSSSRGPPTEGSCTSWAPPLAPSIRDATCPIEVVPPIDETLHLEHLDDAAVPVS